MSANHHYIPQLYLRGFTSNDGKIQVYNKEYSRFEANKHTPKTIFFERHKNTIYFNGVQTDIIESLYSGLENGFGHLFNAVRSGNVRSELISKDGIQLIKQYISVQFWRLPILDSLAEYYIDNIPLKRYGDKLKFNGTPIGEIQTISDLLTSDQGFRHYFRCFLLPLLTFNWSVSDDEIKNWHIYEVSQDNSEWDNFLCNDKSLIIEKVECLFNFNTKLIFPLSKNILVTHSTNENNDHELSPLFSTKLAILTFSKSWGQVFHCANNFSYHYKRQLLCTMKDLTLIFALARNNPAMAFTSLNHHMDPDE